MYTPYKNLNIWKKTYRVPLQQAELQLVQSKNVKPLGPTNQCQLYSFPSCRRQDDSCLQLLQVRHRSSCWPVKSKQLTVYSLPKGDTAHAVLRTDISTVTFHTPEVWYYIFLYMFQKISNVRRIINPTINFLSVAYMEMQMWTTRQLAPGRMRATCVRKRSILEVLHTRTDARSFICE